MTYSKTLCALVCVLAATTAQAGDRARGYFISIDGLQPQLLDELQAAGRLTAPRGFHWLLEQGARVERIWPATTTLTAPSHVSTITCSPPSRHGIVANAFLAGGRKVSGFNESFASEPLWRAAARQGKKTLSLAYVGADGRTPERSVDFGLAYPDDALMGGHQILDWDLATLPAAQGWTLTDGATGTGLKEAAVHVTLNPKTAEMRTLNVLLDVSGPEGAVLTVDTDKDLTNGTLGQLTGRDAARTLDVFFVETSDVSTMKGGKRRAFLRLLPADGGKVSVYVSKASYNNAHPAAFKQRLDELDLVWPDYGVRSPKLSLGETVEAQAMIDRFLATVGSRLAPELDVDLVLFYQPLIDTVGHKLQSSLPLPFDPARTDEVTQAFVTAFRIIDENVSALLGRAGERDVIALMGDHGMDATRKVVNLAPLLPRDHVGKIDVITSGALAMIYAAAGAPAADAETLGQGLKDQLAALQFEDKPALGDSYQKSRVTGDWYWGEATWAYTSASGLYYIYNPLSTDILVEPSALGMHGHALSVPTMATTLLVKGPGATAGLRTAEASLLDAVPTFTRLLGLQPPRDCVGRVLDLSRE